MRGNTISSASAANALRIEMSLSVEQLCVKNVAYLLLSPMRVATSVEKYNWGPVQVLGWVKVIKGTEEVKGLGK